MLLIQVVFAKASNMTGEEFLNRLDFYAKAWLPARDIVISALSNRKAVHPSGHIIVFEQFAPWKVKKSPSIFLKLLLLTII